MLLKLRKIIKIRFLTMNIWNFFNPGIKAPWRGPRRGRVFFQVLGKYLFYKDAGTKTHRSS